MAYSKKKILAIFDGINATGYVLAASVNVAKSTNSMLSAIFINSGQNGVEGNYFFPNDLSLATNAFTGNSVKEENSKMIDFNVKAFQKKSLEQRIECEINDFEKVSLKALREMSTNFIFLLADTKYFYNDSLIYESQCPLLLVSFDMKNLEKIIFVYDASPSYAKSIKLFCDLFPQYQTAKVLLVALHNKDGDPYNEIEIKALIPSPFNNLQTEFISDKSPDTLPDFINQFDENCLVVMGIPKRSAIGRLFYEDLPTTVIQETKCSFFLTH